MVLDGAQDAERRAKEMHSWAVNSGVSIIPLEHQFLRLQLRRILPAVVRAVESLAVVIHE